jgi:hypothetical protein
MRSVSLFKQTSIAFRASLLRLSFRSLSLSTPLSFSSSSKSTKVTLCRLTCLPFSTPLPFPLAEGKCVRDPSRGVTGGAESAPVDEVAGEPRCCCWCSGRVGIGGNGAWNVEGDFKSTNGVGRGRVVEAVPEDLMLDALEEVVVPNVLEALPFGAEAPFLREETEAAEPEGVVRDAGFSSSSSSSSDDSEVSVSGGKGLVTGNEGVETDAFERAYPPKEACDCREFGKGRPCDDCD